MQFSPVSLLSAVASCLLLAPSLALPVVDKPQATCAPVSQGYDVESVISKGAAVAQHTYEYGWHAEALLEYYNPELAVFNAYAFPQGGIPTVNGSEQGLAYAKSHIATGQDTLADGDGDSGAPATLGVSAVLLGSVSSAYKTAAQSQAEYLLNTVPKLYNGAISTKTGDDAEAWDEWIMNAAPFLAYYAVSSNNATLLNYTISQIGLYRDLLVTNGTQNGGFCSGAWEHIDSLGTDDDQGVFSAGNGMVAYGIARVLAVVKNWGTSTTYSDEIASLTSWALEVVNALVNGNQRKGGISGPAARVKQDDQGLINVYWVDPNNNPWFGETTGTALTAAAIFRLAVLAPDSFGSDDIITFAQVSRGAINGHVYSDGTLSPAINPYDSTDNVPYSAGSPVGQSSGVYLAAAYRDCVCAGLC